MGWSPKPPPDFEARLIAVEHVAEKTRQKVYRDGKAEEAAADPFEQAPRTQIEPQSAFDVATASGPRHSDGTPVQHGDPAR